MAVFAAGVARLGLRAAGRGISPKEPRRGRGGGPAAARLSEVGATPPSAPEGRGIGDSAGAGAARESAALGKPRICARHFKSLIRINHSIS